MNTSRESNHISIYTNIPFRQEDQQHHPVLSHLFHPTKQIIQLEVLKTSEVNNNYSRHI